jgi:adenylate cyclase class 2
VPAAAATATHEVEVKYRIDDAGALIAALADHGIGLGLPVEQDDQAYAPADWRYGDSKLGVCFVRLRTQAGCHLFTLKRPVDNELACVEHETEVADRYAMHLAVLAMGFRPTVRIVKTRRTAQVGELCVCLDEVDGVGSFLELERMVDANVAATAAQAELAAFVAELGVKANRTDQTYDSLIRAALTATS